MPGIASRARMPSPAAAISLMRLTWMCLLRQPAAHMGPRHLRPALASGLPFRWTYVGLNARREPNSRGDGRVYEFAPNRESIDPPRATARMSPEWDVHGSVLLPSRCSSLQWSRPRRRLA